MHDYLFSTEVVRIAFVLGVAVSMLLYERLHVTTGSIVVPGYIATFLVYPFILVATFANAALSYLIVNRLLRRWFLLYGRTKFTVLCLVSILVQTAMLKLSPSGGWLWESDLKLVVGVGYVVPALIAHDMARQGVRVTVRSVSIAGLIVAAPIGIALAVGLPGVNDLAPLQGAGATAVAVPWIPLAVLLSAAAAWGVSHNHGLRSGGFMGAAFLGILLGDPWQVVVMGVLALITYLLVTRVLMDRIILFGRRKFSSMVLVSSVLSWSLLWIGNHVFSLGVQQHMALGSLALTPLIVPGLLANDMQRTSPLRVLTGATVATAFVLSVTTWVRSTAIGEPAPLSTRVVAVVSLAVVFGPQLVPVQVVELLTRIRTRRSESATRTIPLLAASTPLSTATSFDATDYRTWASMHPEAATEADRWLSQKLATARGVEPVGREAVRSLPRRSSTERSATLPLPRRPSASPDRSGPIGRPALPRAGVPTGLTARSDLAPVGRAAVGGRERAVLPRRDRHDERIGEFDRTAVVIAASAGPRAGVALGGANGRRPPTLPRRPSPAAEPSIVRIPLTALDDARDGVGADI